MDYRKEIAEYLNLVAKTLKKLDQCALNAAMQAIEAAYEQNATIYICGNGGSAATASHFVCDFNKGVSDGKKRRFRMICLNDNVPTMMAVANDISYDNVFIYQLEGILQKNDILIAISGSGNSENIIKAVRYARKTGAAVIGLSGYDGGQLKALSDYSMHVPIENMQVTEDIHMIFDHMMMSIFSKLLL